MLMEEKITMLKNLVESANRYFLYVGEKRYETKNLAEKGMAYLCNVSRPQNKSEAALIIVSVASLVTKELASSPYFNPFVDCIFIFYYSIVEALSDDEKKVIFDMLARTGFVEAAKSYINPKLTEQYKSDAFSKQFSSYRYLIKQPNFWDFLSHFDKSFEPGAKRVQQEKQKRIDAQKRFDERVNNILERMTQNIIDNRGKCFNVPERIQIDGKKYWLKDLTNSFDKRTWAKFVVAVIKAQNNITRDNLDSYDKLIDFIRDINRSRKELYCPGYTGVFTDQTRRNVLKILGISEEELTEEYYYGKDRGRYDEVEYLLTKYASFLNIYLHLGYDNDLEYIRLSLNKKLGGDSYRKSRRKIAEKIAPKELSESQKKKEQKWANILFGQKDR
ncbi:MAG: hypothetical protein IJ560_00545 [Alphaproteobacteria bacterium]|nr:hypothetical protein [Alphaproteobacteria bacterium]